MWLLCPNMADKRCILRFTDFCSLSLYIYIYMDLHISLSHFRLGCGMSLSLSPVCLCVHLGHRWKDLHVSKNIRKKHAKKFKITIDLCYDEILQRIIHYHGENWVYPPLQVCEARYSPISHFSKNHELFIYYVL